MNKLFELGNTYASESSWKDFALVKLCLLSLGLVIGINAPQKYRKTITIASLVIFAATYIPLIAKMIRIAARKTFDE